MLTTLLLLTFIQAYSKGNKRNPQVVVSPQTISIKGNKFMLQYQVFESHDKLSTDIDTVHHQGDYIFFSMEGKAYMNFKGKLDSISYNFPNKESVSFGDTPFIITNLGNGFFRLYQNEEEKNGDYNRATYILEKGELEPLNSDLLENNSSLIPRPLSK